MNRIQLAGIVSATLWLLGLCSMVNAQVQPEDVFVEGVDYRPLVMQTDELETNRQATADLELFYWFGCQPCMQVEATLVQLTQRRPQLSFRQTPLVAHLNWRPQAYIQPMLEQLDANNRLPTRDEIYRQCLTDCSQLESYSAIKQWLSGHMQVEQFPYINEALIWQAEKDYRKRAKSLSISQVPTIIIRGRFVVDADSAQSLPRMLAIVDYLLNLTQE